MASLTHGSSIEEYTFPNSEIRSRGYFSVWLTSSALVLGLFALWSEQPFFIPFFLAGSYLAVLFIFVRTMHVWRDIFNPLCLVLAIGFVRFSCPGILHWSGADPSEEIELFELMGVSDSDWQLAHALALTGVLAVVLGWLLAQEPRVTSPHLKFHLVHGVKYAALAGMLVGFMALSVFLVRNASLDVVASGEFRGTTVQVGTGKYFFLAYMLIAGSALLSCYFIANGRTRLSLIPVGVSTLLYWVLGGRSRAMISLAAGLLLLWYFNRVRSEWRKLSLKPAHIVTAPVALLCMVWVAYVGGLYRGGFGVGAFAAALSLTGLWEYIRWGLYTDLGQLHALAGAITIGPGVLNGETFIGSLAWPLNKFFPIGGRSAGTFIVETLIGFTGDERWAVNASLIGDAYLNFGLLEMVVVMVIYGALLKILYLKFRQGRLHSGVYVLALLYSLLMFWNSIEVWPQALTVLSFALLLILLGQTILQVRSPQALR